MAENDRFEKSLGAGWRAFANFVEGEYPMGLRERYRCTKSTHK